MMFTATEECNDDDVVVVGVVVPGLWWHACTCILHMHATRQSRQSRQPPLTARQSTSHACHAHLLMPHRNAFYCKWDGEQQNVCAKNAQNLKLYSNYLFSCWKCGTAWRQWQYHAHNVKQIAHSYKTVILSATNFVIFVPHLTLNCNSVAGHYG